MKLIEVFSHINRQPLTEQYIRDIVEDTSEVFGPLARVFAKHRRLTGNIKEDRQNLLDVAAAFLMEQEDEEFDPLSHLVKKQLIDEKEDCLLSIGGGGNMKLKKLRINYFSLPAGYTCPFARICKTMMNKHGKAFSSGEKVKSVAQRLGVPPEEVVKCFAASTEGYSPETRRLRWRNYDLLRQFSGDVHGMADLMQRSIEHYENNNPKIKILRIHDSGDFFNQEYFDAWLETAEERPDILFYCYTKSIPFWVNRIDEMPNNFRPIASRGGFFDDLIDKHGLRSAHIVFDADEAKQKGLRIDINDYLAAMGNEDFALLLHGVQKKGTPQSKQSYQNEKIMKQWSSEYDVDQDLFDKTRAGYTKKPDPKQLAKYLKARELRHSQAGKHPKINLPHVANIEKNIEPEDTQLGVPGPEGQVIVAPPKVVKKRKPAPKKKAPVRKKAAPRK